MYRAWLAGCIQVAGGSFCGQVVGPQEFLCVGKEEVAVCLQMDESVVLEELAVAVEEERAGAAFRGLFIWGSEKVSQISLTSPGAKNSWMNSMLVRRNPTFLIPSWRAS